MVVGQVLRAIQYSTCSSWPRSLTPNGAGMGSLLRRSVLSRRWLDEAGRGVAEVACAGAAARGRVGSGGA